MLREVGMQTKMNLLYASQSISGLLYSSEWQW